MYSKWISDTTPIKDVEYLSIYLRADSMQKIYVREDYSILVYLGDIGGLLDFVLIFGWALSHSFVKRLFQAALVEKVYRLQNYLHDMTPYYKTRITGQLTPRDQQSDSTPSSDSSDNSSSGSSQYSPVKPETKIKQTKIRRQSAANVSVFKNQNMLLEPDKPAVNTINDKLEFIPAL